MNDTGTIGSETVYLLTHFLFTRFIKLLVKGRQPNFISRLDKV